MTFLEKILAEKKKEVAQLKTQPLPPATAIQPGASFKDRVASSDHLSIISEIKRASPSKGAIDMSVDPVQQAIAYEEHGAAAISVLTDTPFFQGSMDDLKAVREATSLPILCKDFIIDRIQIDHAKAAGANIILLIVAALKSNQLKDLHAYALSLGLDVLIEVHDEPEMEAALALEPGIVGINNRNLKTFEVDLTVTERLAAMAPSDTILVSESGMRTKADAQFAAEAGAEVILVGETLMRSQSLQETFADLRVPLQAGRSSLNAR